MDDFAAAKAMLLETRFAERVTSASVTLNGVDVAGPNDFNNQVALVERPLNLSGGANTIAVRYVSAA